MVFFRREIVHYFQTQPSLQFWRFDIFMVSQGNEIIPRAGWGESVVFVSLSSSVVHHDIIFCHPLEDWICRQSHHPQGSWRVGACSVPTGSYARVSRLGGEKVSPTKGEMPELAWKKKTEKKEKTEIWSSLRHRTIINRIVGHRLPRLTCNIFFAPTKR